MKKVLGLPIIFLWLINFTYSFHWGQNKESSLYSKASFFLLLRSSWPFPFWYEGFVPILDQVVCRLGIAWGVSLKKGIVYKNDLKFNWSSDLHAYWKFCWLLQFVRQSWKKNSSQITYPTGANLVFRRINDLEYLYLPIG